MNAIARTRLRTQGISHPGTGTPADVVRFLGAVQAQDYLGAKWSIGLRLRDVDDAEVERACNDGVILRTHLLRPTWHFVLPQDIRWLLALTAPRVLASNAPVARRLGLDARTVARALDVIAREVEGGRWRTREELGAALVRARIRPAAGQRLAYLVMHAEQEAVVCSGPRRGKQFTYALLDERAPRTRTLDRDEALQRIAVRFFTSRGPATAHDLARWSSLTLADVRRSVEAAGDLLRGETLEGVPHWSAAGGAPETGPSVRRAHLLCVYDEYLSGYRDRSAIIAPADAHIITGRGAAVTQVFVIDGRIRGLWSRNFSRRDVGIRLEPFGSLAAAERRALDAPAKAYGRYLGLTPVVGLA